MSDIIRFEVKDKLCLKKKHPCGFEIFSVARCGSDVKIICDGCGRDLTFEREALEKMIKRVITPKNKQI